MELITLGLFCTVLLASIIFGFSLVAALLVGLVIFLTYAALRGFTPSEMLCMVIDGVKKAKNILITFILIGMMTALWRAAGTIPAIVSYSANLLLPQLIVIMSFLLNCLVSFLTGTSFGTGATIGVICSSVGLAMGINPVLLGGAILSGCYFGDRCSPVSTSMLLTATLTETDPYRNIRRMFRSAAVPFALSCMIYVIAGFLAAPTGSTPDMAAVFSSAFVIHPAALLPAIMILVLAIARMPVKKAMLISIAVSIPICIFLQKETVPALLRYMLTGFQVSDPKLAALVNGGGIKNMLKVGSIVCISSAYSGIFEKTGLLKSIKGYITLLAERTNGFAATLCTSLLCAMAACNQTLTIMLTAQLCKELCKDKEDFALWLEDTAVVIAPLIPWSIAGSTILNTTGLPLSSVLLSVYLYLLPLWGLITAFTGKKITGKAPVS